MKRSALMAATTAAALAFGTAVAASTIVLDFEGVNASYPSGFAFVEDFYNGGTSSDGTSGTDFGVSFSSNAQAICLNTPGVSCSNTSRGGLGNPDSQKGGLFFLGGAETFMNVAAGFTTGFSFFYTAINNPGSVSVYDGLGGTGTLLATLALPTTSSTCDPIYGAGFCPFVPIGVSFEGTAKSVSFAGVANQIVFDDVTFGSATPGDPGVGVIPLPAGLPLLLGGLAMLGLVRRRSA
jgi:hypothetical protein